MRDASQVAATEPRISERIRPLPELGEAVILATDIIVFRAHGIPLPGEAHRSFADV